MRSLMQGIGIAAALGLWAGSIPTLASASDVEIEGTWYVLIHYRDPDSANPDADRWQDRVWTFERKGSRLQWTEYPLVVFDDRRGRFEAIPGNARSRVLEAWEPNAEQRRELSLGPTVNTSRGMRTKSLRGSNSGGWETANRMRQTSVAVMGYLEQLSIKNLQDKPVLERRDFVGNAATGSDGGATRFEVSDIEMDGNLLKGRYQRDERLKGTFKMWRTPPPHAPKKQDRTPNERAAERLMNEAKQPDP